MAEAYRVYDNAAQPRLARTIDYDYDSLYRLTAADYSTGEAYSYQYDPVGNRLQQVINGDTTAYTYDAANRLTSINGFSLSYDNNGNRLTSEAQTHTWDAANRLTQVSGAQATVNTVYDGLGNRVSQTAEGVTTNYALDTAIGLAEVIFTSAGHSYLHLPGLIMTESAGGATRYLLSDGLGSVRHVTDEAGAVVSTQAFDPYGNPLASGGEPYGYTGEWWSADVGLLHLRARWYDPASGTFLSRDAVESEPPYQYVGGDPINFTDPTGMWRWRGHGHNTLNFYHDAIEDYYESNGAYPNLLFGNPNKHIEFTLPSGRSRVDIFNSITGDVYEIEPINKAIVALPEAMLYAIELNVESSLGNLQGAHRGILPYNWNGMTFHPGFGSDWPGKFTVPFPGFPVNLVADYVWPGTILYWLEPQAPVAIPKHVHAPNKNLVKPQGYVPTTSRILQPAYVVNWDDALHTCGYVIVTIGGAILIANLVENAATAGLGFADDVAVVPAGFAFIYVGEKMVTFVPEK